MRRNFTDPCRRLRPGRFRHHREAGATALVFLLAAFSQAQDSRFLFDPKGNLTAHLSGTTLPPEIIGQPQNQVVATHESAAFSVVVADPRSISYQWRFKGANLSGETAVSLGLDNVTTNNEGQYQVVLANPSGSATSAPAMLWIDNDRDGLGDSWELANFGNLSRTATGDFDGDGVSNLEEFLKGTDPTNPNSARYQLLVIRDGGSVIISPAQTTYSKGDIVTLTAVPASNELFHAWLGEVVTRDNPITLVMTNDKAVYARFTPIEFTWINPSSGNWEEATNWSPRLAPGLNDSVIINGGMTVTLNTNADCAEITLGETGSPTLTGNGALTVRSNFFWGGGNLNGSARTVVETNAVLNVVPPPGGASLNSRILENAGTILWSAGFFYVGGGAVISNRPGATIRFENAASTSLGGGIANGRIDNAGFLLKATNTGPLSIEAGLNLNNFGTVQIGANSLVCNSSFVNSGTLILLPGATNRIAGSGSSSGAFIGAASALVEWPGGNFAFNPGAQLNGSGVYRIGGSANVTVNANFTVENLDFVSSSALLSGTGTMTVANTMNWTGGTMNGSGRTIIAPGATLNLGQVSLGRTLENGGTILWTGSGLILSGAVITNRAGALFDSQTDVTPFFAGVACRIDNSGTFRKSAGPGATTLPSGVAFNNFGAVDIQTGRLVLAGGGSATGTFTVPAATSVEWASGAFALNTGAQLIGAGLYEVSGATVTGNTTLTVANLDLTAGTVDGSGVITIEGTMNWTGGTMAGSGTTIIAPTALLNLSGSSGLFLARILENGGTVLWTGSGNMGMGVITNRLGAFFDVRSSPGLNFFAANPRFDNAGTFRKSISSGVVTIGPNFTNSGTVELQTGTLLCNGSFANSGAVNLSAGATHRLAGGGAATGTFDAPLSSLVEWTGGTFILNGSAQLNGAGLYKINGGTLTDGATLTVQNLDLTVGVLNGAAVLTISNQMNWTGGSMSGSGRTIISPAATLAVGSSSALGLDTRVLENAGTAIWTGSGGIGLVAAVITNRSGALFDAQSSSTFGTIGSSRFDNVGTFRKSVSTGTTLSGIGFNNSGTVDVQTGTLSLGGDGTHSGSFNVLAGATLAFSGGIHSANGSSSVTGAGQLVVSGATANLAGLVNVSGNNTFTGGTANFTGTHICTNNAVTISGGTANWSGAGSVSPATLNLSGGVLSGTSTVSVANTMNWTGGQMSGSGRTIISPIATLNVNSPSGVNLINRTLENGGTVLWNGPGAIVFGQSVITNGTGALFHAQSAAGFATLGSPNRFDNAGTFRKSGSSGATTTGAVTINNSGMVDIRSGILKAESGYTSTSSALLSCALGGMTAGTGFGQLQVAGSVTLAGNLSVTLTNNFVPPANSTYTVLSAGTRNGTFANFFYPSNSTDMVMSNTPNSVVVRALGAYFATTSLPDAMRNVGYTQQVTAVMNSNPIVYSLVSGALPPGLSLSTSGLISGTPTSFGQSLFSIQASNAAGVTIQQPLVLHVRNLPPEGLISWWRAENNALDSISTNHGVLTNGAGFAVGKVGQTFALDGVNDYVNIPDSSSLRPSSVTLEAWAMFNSQNGPVFTKPLGAATGDSFALFLLSGALQGFIHDTNASGVLVSSPFTLSLGQWHHVAFTFDDSTKEQALYVNGVRVATSQSNRSIGYDNHPVLLGQDINNGNFDFPLNGQIDEPSIYNRALSSNEIAAIYNAGVSGKPINIPYFTSTAQLADAVLNVGYTQQVIAVLGTGPITFSAPSGGLPPGLSLSSTGTISGIPLVGGPSSFVIRATDSLGAFSDQLTTLRVFSPVPAPSGLISWWRAEGNALDSAGSNHGTASNGVAYVQGKVGQAFAFDGINDFVFVPDATNLRPTSITLEAWARFNGAQGPVLGRSWGTGIHNSYIIWQLSGNINGTIGDTNQAADILSTPFTPVQGQWYHVAFTFDDVTKQHAFYLDGALVASGQTFRSVGYDNHPLLLGGDIDNGSVSFLLDGGVDEAAIYNRALTASEIAAIYNAGIAGKQLFTPYQQWKLIYFGDINTPDTADPDGDGFNNLAEYTADTNPTNALSNLRVTGVTLVPAGVAIQWRGGTLATQFLQRSFSLGPASSWQDLFTNLPPTPSPSSFTNSAGTSDVQFYRLRVTR
jgi:hypothetical protein